MRLKFLNSSRSKKRYEDEVIDVKDVSFEGNNIQFREKMYLSRPAIYLS